jgi:predicted nucleic acid-binding protein
MGTAYILDTSAYSKYVTGLLESNATGLMNEVLLLKPIISVVTKIELMSWKTTNELEKDTEIFIEASEVLNLDDAIINKTIEIRRKVKIKLPDAIIAATAIIHNLTLLSTNDSDFLKVPKLKYKSLNSNN